MENRQYYKKFKYTRNRERIIFTKSIDKKKIFDAIGDINWSTFDFNGMVSLKTWDDERDMSVYKDVPVTAKSPEFPPKIFGGAVYELLNIKFPSSDLYNYMDITGDIDVQIATPQLITANGSTEDIMLYEMGHIDDTGNINNLVMVYLTWLSNEFSTQIQNHKLFNTRLQPFEPNPNSLLVVDVYNNNTVYIVIVREQHMIKVQVDIKIKGMSDSDHVVEFVLIEPSDGETFSKKYNQFKLGTTNLHIKGHTYLIEDLPSLVNGNLNSMVNRIIILQNKQHDTIKYKFFNHVARLQYLNLIQDKFLMLHSPSIIRTSQFIDKYIRIIMELLQFIKLQDLCIFLYLNESCNKHNTYKIIHSMTYKFIQYIKNNITNDKHNVYIKLKPTDRRPIQIQTSPFIKEFIHEHLQRPSVKERSASRPKSAPSNTRSKKSTRHKNSQKHKSAPSNTRSKKYKK
jgi:hypothetical protein